MKTIIRFFIYQLIIATIFNVFVEKSILKAQPKYFNISICKMHKELQDKGNGKCATCNNSVSSSSKRAKFVKSAG